MRDDGSIAAAPTRPPTLADLVRGFFVLGVTGFGGVMPLAHRMIVEERRWVDEQEFTELLGLCQFLPGGNVCNLAVAIGWRFAGSLGAAAALVALLAAPIVLVIALGALYAAYSSDAMVRAAFEGLGAAAAGLFVATALKLGRPLRRDLRGIALAAAVLLAVGVFHVPLIVAVVVSVPLGYLVAGAGA